MDTLYNPNQSVNPTSLSYGHTTSDKFFKSPLASEFDTYGDAPFDGAYDSSTSTELGHRNQDSAIDLTRLPHLQQEQSYSCAKDDDPADFDAFLETPYSSQTSNTPSPNADFIFSNNNSPRDFARDQSQTSSPETNNDLLCQEAMACRTDDSHLSSTTPDVIYIPQSIEPPTVSVFPSKTKTRAETQIKMTIVLDPLPDHFMWARFPRNTLSKPNQLASDDEIQANERRDGAVRIRLSLVCATAVDKKDGMDRALRRARGDEKIPRRPQGVAINEIDKDDPAHPQKGGALLICEGCKERERKRYDRKKKRNEDEDENEWTQYEDERIIIVNEKEFKRWQDMESDGQYTSAAKKVEFAMRIACYCRHQEEKSPVGYRVIFTFMDENDTLLSQHASEIIQITDDHKNKEAPADVLHPPLTISTTNPTMRQDLLPWQYSAPLFQHNPTIYSAYSQRTTPVISQFQSPMTFTDGQYNQITNHTVAPPRSRQTSLTFPGAAISAPAPTTQYSMHQRSQNSYNTPMVSQIDQVPSQAGYPRHRPHSLVSFSQALSFNFQQPKYSQPNHYPQRLTSQPPSRHQSRSASRSWDQGRKKRARAVFDVAGGDLEE